jgi:hypothetical protein
MPLMKGMKPAVVSHNIREMVKAGHPQKQAIAAALSMKRKAMKKMAAGGLVTHDDDEDGDEMSIVGYDELGKMDPDGVENPAHQEAQRKLAQRLYERSEMEGTGYAQGGLVQGPMDGMQGAEPELDWIDDGTEEPMSSMPDKPAALGDAVIEGVPELSPSPLSAEAMKALKEKKMKRRYAMV